MTQRKFRTGPKVDSPGQLIAELMERDGRTPYAVAKLAGVSADSLRRWIAEPGWGMRLDGFLRVLQALHHDAETQIGRLPQINLTVPMPSGGPKKKIRKPVLRPRLGNRKPVSKAAG